MINVAPIPHAIPFFKRRQVWRPMMNAIDGRCLTFAVCGGRRSG
jgi:hypothetical protein